LLVVLSLETVASDPDEDELSTEKPELELDERELERECMDEVDVTETGDEFVERGGAGMVGNWLRMGVIQVGSRTSSAIIANNSSSS